MKSLISSVGLEFEETLIKPTIAGNDWLGNSHYGPIKGISNKVSKNYTKVLRDDELNKIKQLTIKITDQINNESTPVNLLDIPIKFFYQYNEQKKYFNDTEKIVLYYALVNSPKRRFPIQKAPLYAILASFYSLIVRVLHIPRMIKLKFFKGKGKQNYT